jgi:hypothetical protein
MPLNLPAPRLRNFYRAFIDVGAPLVVGEVDGGQRRIVPITGGHFEGAREGAPFNGEILAGGADWQIVYPDLTTVVEARFVMRTADGAVIDLRNTGVRHGPSEVMQQLMRGEAVDPTAYSFRMTPRLSTGDARYAWLNKLVCVASGMRAASRVVYDVYEVL